MKRKNLMTVALSAGILSATATAGFGNGLLWQGPAAESPAIARELVNPPVADSGEKTPPMRASIIPVMLPWSVTLTDEDSFDLFDVIDANNDQSTWQFWTKDGLNYNAVYRANSRNSADDWLVTPPIPMKGGTNYLLTFNASGNSDYYTEKLEVVAAVYPTIAAFTQGEAILPVTELKSATQELTATFKPSTDGNYFFGFHAVSDADQDYITLYDVSVEVGAEDSAPGAVSGLTVTPDPSGELIADISFTAPSKTVAGDKLQAISKVEILRNNDVVETLQAVAPGTQLSFRDDKVIENGYNTYSVVAYADEKKGREAKATVFVGVDVPVMPADFSLSDVGDGIKAQWSKVTEGANGLYVNPDKIVYRIMGFDADQQPTILVAEVAGANEYLIEGNTLEGEQHLAQYAVQATTRAGESQQRYSNALLVGAPYQLPFIESFYDEENGVPGLNNFWYFDGEGMGYSFGLSNVSFVPGSSDFDNSSLKFNTVGYNDVLNLTSGRVKISGTGNKLFFDYRTDGAQTSEFNLYAVMPDGNVLSLKKYDITQKCGWTHEIVDLPSYLSAMDYVMVRFQIKSTGSPDVPQTLYIDNVNITDPSRKDLKISLVLPDEVQKGKDALAKVIVRNRAGADVDSYTYTLTADGKEIVSATIDEKIPAFTSREFDVLIPTSAVNDADKVRVKATVSCDNDAEAGNNVAESVFAIYSYNGPAVTSLNLSADNNGNHLSWTAPEIVNIPVEESFEEYTPFLIDRFGDWTAFSNDETYAGGIFEDFDMPHQYENYAFMVTNFEPDYGAGDYYPGHTGYAYLGAVYGINEELEYASTDKWLISPSLSGNAQTISFWARNTPLENQDMPESVAVGYSSTGTAMSDFVWVKTQTIKSGVWTKITANLPVGATYFAVRTNEEDTPGHWLLLDDFSFETGPGSVAKYAIYCNGNKVGESDTESFTDTTPRQAGDRYDVTSLFVNGNESAPATAYVGNAGIDEINIDSLTDEYRIYNLQGIRVTAPSKGIYIINGRKTLLK